jgi:hypothetical protein
VLRSGEAAYATAMMAAKEKNFMIADVVENATKT